MTKKQLRALKKQAGILDRQIWARGRKLSGSCIPYDLDPETPGYWEMDAEHGKIMDLIEQQHGQN